MPATDVPILIRWILWGIITGLGIIVSMIVLIGQMNYRNMKHLDIIKNRYPKMVIFETYLSIIYMCVIVSSSLLNISEIDYIKPYQDNIEKIHTILYIYTNHGIILTKGLRLFLMFYKINYSYYNDNKKWIKHINEDILHQNVFTKYKHTFGNIKFMYKYVLIYYFILTSLLTLLAILYNNNNTMLFSFIDGGFYFIVIIIILVTYYKCPIFNDKFYFYYEFKKITYLLIFGMMFYTPYIIIFIYISQYYAHVFAMLNVIIVIGGMGILSTHIIILKVNNDQVWSNKDNNDTESPRLNLESPPSDSDTNTKNIKFKHTKLCDILQSSQIIGFAQHLIYEFSLECLTSYIEFIQYKRFVKRSLNMKSKNKTNNTCENDAFLSLSMDDSKNIDRKVYIKFCNEVPKSLLINNITKENGNINTKCIKLLAYQLYLKYIKSESKYEINISYDQRQYFIDLMNDKETWLNNNNFIDKELFHLFDDIILTMYDLMDGSFARFIFTDY